MKYIDEFRDRKLIDKVARAIEEAAGTDSIYNFMEVCGTHTMSIFKYGLRNILPANIKLVSGPGCPVCVTPGSFIDKAVCLSRNRDIIIATFGDMLKVPGSRSSLEKERSAGAHVKVVYSCLDALKMTRDNRSKEVVFLGVGFETTAPTVAQSIIEAEKMNLRNYSVLCAHKTMPHALKALAADRGLRVDGFLLPGHVSAVIGSRPYNFLARMGKRCVVAGFEPLDIMQSIYMLLKQKRPKVEIQYTRLIAPSGNRAADRVIRKVFEETDAEWRGIGKIGSSGLKIRRKYKKFDADLKFKPVVPKSKENSLCICGDVIKGKRTPLECKLFAKVCTSEHPVGACMVSSEGTCAAYYKYRVR